jgi:hypothetical protein
MTSRFKEEAAMTRPAWTDEDTLRLEMNLTFIYYADAEEAELQRLRALLDCLVTDVLRGNEQPPTPNEVSAILHQFRSVMVDPKAWADWVEEAHEIVRYTAEGFGGDGEIFVRA